jgi:hypothetical protein
LREYKDGHKLIKYENHFSYNNTNYNPQVDLEIEGIMVNQVVVDFGSQVNILPQETWIRMGQPSLVHTMNYLKLFDQILIESIGILRNVDTQIMGISTSVDFKVIKLVKIILAYASLVARP